MIRAIFSLLFPSSCFNCKNYGEPLCRVCLRTARRSLLSPAPYIVTVFDYQDPLIKRSIHAMKYFGRKDLIESFSLELAHTLRNIPDYQRYTLVPIPMPLVRKCIRGYNQAEVLAQLIASQCALYVDTSFLRRNKTPQRQVAAKTRDKRLINQRGTFTCKNVSGKHIMLIDDVTTTGATFKEARRMLLLAGAADVRALAIAH